MALKEHTINLVRPGEPLGKSPPRYRRSDTDRAFIEEWVSWMKEFGLVEEAPDATFAMNRNIVKKGEKWRVCIDPRILNTKTTTDPFPSLTIDEIFHSLRGSIVFSGLDAAAGYWQIPIKKEHRKYTAFRVDNAVYQFIVMPFGLKNAPATFNRWMEKAFGGMRRFVKNYIDDIVVKTSTRWMDHVRQLEQVFQRCDEMGITLKL